MTFEDVSFEEFNKAAGEWHRAWPELSDDQFENGKKAFVLMYFGLKDDPLTNIQGKALFEFLMRRYLLEAGARNLL